MLRPDRRELRASTMAMREEPRRDALQENVGQVDVKLRPAQSAATTGRLHYSNVLTRHYLLGAVRRRNSSACEATRCCSGPT